MTAIAHTVRTALDRVVRHTSAVCAADTTGSAHCRSFPAAAATGHSRSSDSTVKRNVRGEVRLHGNGLEALAAHGPGERVGGAHELGHAAAARRVGDDARVHRCRADVRVAAVDGPADDEGLVEDFLRAGEVWGGAWDDAVADAVGWALEGCELVGRGLGAVGAVDAAFRGDPEGGCAGEILHREPLL